MSGALTFADIFRQARAKSAVTGESSPVQPSALAVCGSGKSALIFTSENIEFLNKDDVVTKFGWVQLDFVLPGDLSLASDKLYTFTDLETPARRIANTVGKIVAWVAVAYFAYLVWGVLYALIIHPILWLLQWGVLGFIGAALYGGAILMFGWWLLVIPLGIFASGGAFAAMGHWLGRQIRPLILFVLRRRYSGVENGLHIISQEWVGMPWEPRAQRALDLIFIGLKLRRRGLA